MELPSFHYYTIIIVFEVYARHYVSDGFSSIECNGGNVMMHLPSVSLILSVQRKYLIIALIVMNFIG